jgi:periplasmic divalent cation tolerance protein
METQPIVVLITAPSKEVGEQITASLLEKQLAACVNIVSPLSSIFTWQGEINHDEEALLIVKSRADLFESQLIPAVLAIHPYQVPEIIALPVSMGLSSYLKWVEEVTLPPSG